MVSRTGYTGEDGFEVIVGAPATAVRVWEALLESGRPHGIVPCGLGARDTLRFEAAMPLYGHELTETINPYAAGLGWAVKLDKGEFVGRDALAAPQGSTPAGRGSACASKASGSPARGPSCSPATARRRAGHLGHVRADPASRAWPWRWSTRTSPALGTALTVDIRGHHEPARVVKLPFYRREARQTDPLRLGSHSEDFAMDPKTLRYAPTHEWVHLDGDVATVGISKFAVDQLTDLIMIDLPAVGTKLAARQELRRGRERQGRQRPLCPGRRRGRRGQRPRSPGTSSSSPTTPTAGLADQGRVDDPSAASQLLDHDAYEKKVAEEATDRPGSPRPPDHSAGR